MEHTIRTKIMTTINKRMKTYASEVVNLVKAQVNREYTVKEIKTNDDELKNFLFTLGCYEGETVTVLSVLGENYVVSVKDSRYCIDRDLAEAIIV